MTLNQFFKELRKHRGKFELNGKYEEVRTKNCRLISESWPHVRPLCPIEEVHRVRSKKRYDGWIESATQALGLSKQVADRIIIAADSKRSKYRKPLLRALGL